jgi:hypothetical protein
MIHIILYRWKNMIMKYAVYVNQRCEDMYGERVCDCKDGPRESSVQSRAPAKTYARNGV